MNALGLALVWIAVQTTLLLIPAVLLHAFASQKGPAAGAWVASLSLVMVLLLGGLELWPDADVSNAGIQRSVNGSDSVAPGKWPDRSTLSPGMDPSAAGDTSGLGWSVSSLTQRWRALGRLTTRPLYPYRGWGWIVAVIAMIGITAGLLWLLLGGLAVFHLTRRARPIAEPRLLGLVAELKAELRCQRRVGLYEFSGLATAATAGCFRSLIFLPDDWPSWSEHDRRAVLGHELAHIQHHDYTWTLLARFVTALHFYHPLVHWLAARLSWQQELAADALGARVAGGPERYLLTLSRFALRQDVHYRSWPARAFLPAEGTLIRRITMLQKSSMIEERTWTWPRRSLALGLLLGLTITLSAFRGPAWGEAPAALGVAGKDARPAAQPKNTSELEPFDFSYLSQKPQLINAIRPAAALRGAEMAVYRTMINGLIADEWAMGAKLVGFDPTKPGQQAPRIEMIDQLVAPMRVVHFRKGRKSHRIDTDQSILVKTTEPIDWLKLLRLWKLEVIEKRVGDRVYHKIKTSNPYFNALCVYSPDSRTLVWINEARLLEKWKQTAPAPPPVFAQAPGWEQLRRGLVLVAADNRDGSVAKNFEETIYDDFDYANIFKHTSLMTLSIANGDTPSLELSASCPDAASSKRASLAFQTMLDKFRHVAPGKPESNESDNLIADRGTQMLKSFAAGSKVVTEGTSVIIRSSRACRVSDLLGLICCGELDLASGPPVP